MLSPSLSSLLSPPPSLTSVLSVSCEGYAGWVDKGRNRAADIASRRQGTVKTQAGTEGRHEEMGSDSGRLLRLHRKTGAVLCCVLLLNCSSVAWRMVQTSQVIRQELELDGGLP